MYFPLNETLVFEEVKDPANSSRKAPVETSFFNGTIGPLFQRDLVGMGRAMVRCRFQNDGISHSGLNSAEGKGPRFDSDFYWVVNGTRSGLNTYLRVLSLAWGCN